MHARSYPRIIVLAMAAATVMGCQPVWVKSADGPQDFASTKAACDADTGRGFFGNGIPSIANRQAYFNRCVEAQGYRQVDPHDVPSGAVAYKSASPTGFYPYPTARN